MASRSRWWLQILLLRMDAAAAGCVARGLLIAHLAFVADYGGERPRQGLHHDLSSRLRQMTPKLFELRRLTRGLLILAGRGGAVAGILSIDFFLEIER